MRNLGCIIAIIVWFFISVILGNALTGGYNDSRTSVTMWIFFGFPIIAAIVYDISNKSKSNASSAKTTLLMNNKYVCKFESSHNRYNEIKNSIDEALKAKSVINENINQDKNDILRLKRKHLISCFMVYGLFNKSYKTKIESLEKNIIALNKEKNGIRYNLNSSSTAKFEILKKSYNDWTKSSKIWQDGREINDYNNCESDYSIISATTKPMIFNFTGEYCVYVFSNVVLIYDAIGTFVDACYSTCFSISVSTEECREEKNVPDDAIVLRKTWLHPCRDGSPDLRYSVNYQIYTVKYGRIKFCFCNYSASFRVSSYDNCTNLEKCLNSFKVVKNYKEKTASSTVSTDRVLANSVDGEDKGNLSSVQKKIKSAEIQYKNCSTVNEIIDCYLQSIPQNEWLSAIQLGVLRYYLTNKTTLFKHRALDTTMLANVITQRVSGEHISLKCDTKFSRTDVKVNRGSSANTSDNNPTSVQIKMSEAKKDYAECGSLSAVLEKYIEITPHEERYNTVKLSILLWYISQERQFISRNNLNIASLKSLIADRVPQNDGTMQEKGALMSRLVNTINSISAKQEQQTLLPEDEDDNNDFDDDTPHLSISIFNRTYTLGSDGMIETTPEYQGLSEDEINEVEQFESRISHKVYHLTTLESIIDEYILVVPEDKVLNDLYISKLLNCINNGYQQFNNKFSKEQIIKGIKNTINPPSQSGIAEFQMDDNAENDTQYSSQAIVFGDNLKFPKHIEKYNQMKKISPLNSSNWGYTYYDKEEKFYLQAKFMADFEDNYEKAEEFMTYSPTYEDMSLNQLRSYFTWRAKIRKGEIQQTSLSYAYVYVYELLNQIGVANSADGLDKLINFCLVYREYDNHLDRYLPRWIKDYVIFYGGELKELDKLPKIRNYSDSSDSAAILEALNTNQYCGFAELMNTRSSYKIVKSKFFTSSLGYKFNEALSYVMQSLNDHYGKNTKNTLIKRLVGKERHSEWWEPFRQAVVLKKKNYTAKEVVINSCEKYHCENGRWTQIIYADYDPQYIGAILRTTEYYLREIMNYPYKIKFEDVPQNLNHVIKKSVQKYCDDTKITGLGRQFLSIAKTEAKKKAETVKPKPVVINIDTSKLQSIRRDAQVIQEKLIVEDSIFNQQDSKNTTNIASDKDFTATIEIGKINSVEAVSFLPVHKEIIKALIKQEDTMGVVNAILQRENMLFEVVLEDINEKAYDIFSDNIIDTTEIPPYIYEDYLDKVKSMLGEE